MWTDCSLDPGLRTPSALTEFCGSFLDVDEGGFGGQVGARAPCGQRSLAGVELLSEELLELHADLDEVGRGAPGDDHLEDVPLQVSVDEDLTEQVERRGHGGSLKECCSEWRTYSYPEAPSKRRLSKR